MRRLARPAAALRCGARAQQAVQQHQPPSCCCWRTAAVEAACVAPAAAAAAPSPAPSPSPQLGGLTPAVYAPWATPLLCTAPCSPLPVRCPLPALLLTALPAAAAARAAPQLTPWPPSAPPPAALGPCRPAVTPASKPRAGAVEEGVRSSAAGVSCRRCAHPQPPPPLSPPPCLPTACPLKEEGWQGQWGRRGGGAGRAGAGQGGWRARDGQCRLGARAGREGALVPPPSRGRVVQPGPAWERVDGGEGAGQGLMVGVACGGGGATARAWAWRRQRAVLRRRGGREALVGAAAEHWQGSWERQQGQGQRGPGVGNKAGARGKAGGPGKGAKLQHAGSSTHTSLTPPGKPLSPPPGSPLPSHRFSGQVTICKRTR